MAELKRRSAGILVHPTSLPGKYGIGDLGPTAHSWIETLARCKQTWWQILPLGPTGAGDSPYQSYSAFAGSPNLISPDLLVEEGLIAATDLKDAHFSPGKVDYGNVSRFKDWLIDRAWQAFNRGAAGHLRDPFAKFQLDEAHWLNDYGLFMAIKNAQDGRSWHTWPTDLIRREPAALERIRHDLTDAIGAQQFRQFLFFRQWQNLRRPRASTRCQAVRRCAHFRIAGFIGRLG